LFPYSGTVRSGTRKNPGDEKHEDDEKRRDRKGYPEIVDDVRRQPDQQGADDPRKQNGTV
jgi:hypothetical protein